MGLLRFLVHPAARLPPHAAARAFVHGPDLIPWAGRVRRTADELIIERSVSDSGNVCVPWPVASQGLVAISTASLMEREQPYQLAVELARGKVNQLRNQWQDWQTAGLITPRPVIEAISRATHEFGQAATAQHEPARAAAHAERSLELAVRAGEALARAFTEQALALRHRAMARLNKLLAADLGSAPLDNETARQFLAAFNSAVAPLLWRRVESTEGNHSWPLFDTQAQWCQQHRLRMIGGPLVQFDSPGLPDWLCLWQGDLDNLLSFVSDYVETVVNRYRGRVAVWHCAARINTGDALSLSDEDRLRLAFRSIEITRRADPSTPTVVSFNQPWAEYMGRAEFDLSPLHFADALVRSNCGLSALGLEINMGYDPGGSYPRDLLDWSRLLDLWTQLGLPLFVWITFPSSSDADVESTRGHRPLVGDGASYSPAEQQAWIDRLLPLLLAKPAVQGIVWRQLRDADPDEFPHGGLFDLIAASKPALLSIQQLRKIHLK